MHFSKILNDLTLCFRIFYSLKSFLGTYWPVLCHTKFIISFRCFLFVLINSNVWYFLLTFYGTCSIQTCCISCFLVSLVIQALLFSLFIWYVLFQFLSMSITKESDGWLSVHSILPTFLIHFSQHRKAYGWLCTWYSYRGREAHPIPVQRSACGPSLSL
jgi:hypothetical protein